MFDKVSSPYARKRPTMSLKSDSEQLKVAPSFKIKKFDKESGSKLLNQGCKTKKVAPI